MKYVIRKVPERDTSKLESAIPEALVFCDFEHRGALWGFEQAINLAADDAVYIQDDMILCRDFKKRAEAEIARHGNSVIVFANFCYEKNQKIYKSGFYVPRDVGFLLCTYIPKRLALAYLDDCESGRWKRGKIIIQQQQDDTDFAKWLSNRGEDMYLVVPNLAGHPKNTSSIDPKRPNRICKNFDYDDTEIQWRN